MGALSQAIFSLDRLTGLSAFSPSRKRKHTKKNRGKMFALVPHETRRRMQFRPWRTLSAFFSPNRQASKNKSKEDALGAHQTCRRMHFRPWRTLRLGEKLECFLSQIQPGLAKALEKHFSRQASKKNRKKMCALGAHQTRR